MTKANTGCARNQGTTQFCAEAVEAHRELREAQAEIERLKADCVEAMELLRAHGQAPTWIYSTGGLAAVNDWNRRYGELLLKHKEAT